MTNTTIRCIIIYRNIYLYVDFSQTPETVDRQENVPTVATETTSSAPPSDLNREIPPESQSTQNAISTLSDPAYYTGRVLSEDEKLAVLSQNFKPHHNFKFPITSGRKFNANWMTGRPCLLYSIKNDAAFCKRCLCFGNNSATHFSCDARAPNESPFASTGFKNWKKAVGQKESYLDQPI